jgi:hypothetical protein
MLHGVSFMISSCFLNAFLKLKCIVSVVSVRHIVLLVEDVKEKENWKVIITLFGDLSQ